MGGEDDIRKADKDVEKGVCKSDKDGEKDTRTILAPLNDVWSPERSKERHEESTPILRPRRMSFSGKEYLSEGAGSRIYGNVENSTKLDCEREKNNEDNRGRENIGETADNVTFVDIEEDIKLSERNGTNPGVVFQEMEILDVSGAIAYVERARKNGDNKLEKVLEMLELDVRKEKEETGELSKRIRDLSQTGDGLRRSARLKARHEKRS